MIVVLALVAIAGADSQPTSASRQPVYVLLVGTIEDHVNLDLSEERVDRLLTLLERERQRQPDSHVSCLLHFTGLTSGALAERPSSGLLDRIRAAVGSGLIEVGYDGTEEPTFASRPRPNLRHAATPEARWLARSEPIAWFLHEHKHIITGEPDPTRPGGLQLTRQVFGEVVSVAGVSLTVGADSELVHVLRHDGVQPLLPGFLDAAVFPPRMMNGYRGASAMVSAVLSPAPDTAPELFSQDGALRSSEYVGPDVRVTAVASDGPESVKAVLEKLDRSHLHVVRVRMAHHGIYAKPSFGARNYTTPLEYAYDNPKNYSLPADAVRPREEIARAYAREEETVRWLADRFFAENPGSRFVSVSDLRRMSAEAGNDSESVPREVISAAAADLLARWTNDAPPAFVQAGERYFSLADVFLLLSSALAERHRTGLLPASVTLTPLYGPLETNDDVGTAGARLTAATVDRACAEVSDRIRDHRWKPVPSNAVPHTVTVGGARVNASQFLRLMARALTGSADTQLVVETASMVSPAGDVYPNTRSRLEKGATWTIKPVRLRGEPRRLSRGGE